MSPSNYGIWATLLSLSGILMMFDMGTRTAVSVGVARARNPKDAGRVLKAALRIYAVLTALILGMAFFAPSISDYLFAQASGPGRSATVAAVVLVLTSVALRLPSNAYLGLFAGSFREARMNRVLIAGHIVRVGVTIVVVLGITAAVYAPAVGLAMGAGVVLLMATQATRRYYPSVLDHPYEAGDARKMLSFSLLIAATSGSSTVLFQFPNILTAKALGTESVALLSIALVLVMTATQAVMGVARLVTPLAAAGAGSSDEGRLARISLISMRVVAYCGGLFTFLGVVGGDGFIRVWAGVGYADAYYPLLVALGAGTLMWPNLAIQGAIVGSGSVSRLAAYWILIAFVSLTAFWIVLTVTQSLSMGLFAWFLGLAFMQLVLLPDSARRVLAVSSGSLVAILGLSGLYIWITAGTARTLLQSWGPTNPYQYWLLILGASLVYLVGGWFLLLRSEDRVTTVALVRRIWR